MSDIDATIGVPTNERSNTMFDENEVITLEGAAFEAEWDAFIADLFDAEPETDGWEG